MRIAGLVSASALMAIAATSIPSVTSAKEPEAIVDALNKLSGKTNARASGAKGQCVKGSYTPSAEAAQLTKSVSFTTASPILGRFSVGSGNPKVADTNKGVVRGFSFKMGPEGSPTTEFVVVNTPINFSKSPEQMLGFIEARFPGADGKPDTDKIKAFATANPETTRQGAWLAGKPLPASWAGVTYWGIHTYTATNAKGETKPIKFKFVPTGGELGLTEEEAKAKGADFLLADLTDRIAKKTVSFDVVALMGKADDPATDITVRWPDEDARPTVKLGTIAITAIEKNETCDGGIFDPTNLADGIGAPQDSMFLPRQPAYAISLTRRSN